MRLSDAICPMAKRRTQVRWQTASIQPGSPRNTFANDFACRILYDGVPRGGGLRDDIFYETQAAIAFEREHGFRMKLHAFDGQVAVARAHDDAVVRFGSNLEAGGEGLAASE